MGLRVGVVGRWVQGWCGVAGRGRELEGAAVVVAGVCSESELVLRQKSGLVLACGRPSNEITNSFEGTYTFLEIQMDQN